MQKLFTIALTACMCMMIGGSAIGAGAPQVPADHSSPELERIKSLAGRWTTTTSMFGKPNQRVFIEFEVTAGGSAVLERIFPGTPEEMISVYYDDNGKLAMTHYCIMRNRPLLKLARSDADSITLDVKKIDGAKSKKDPAMGGVTIRFKDANHIEETCRSADKNNEAPMTMVYTRVR